MKVPKVSIIVPCYNQSNYIEETLNSVKKQTYENIECIIVNDGSIDNSLERIQLFCSQDSRFMYIDKTNEGVSVARNVGIANSNGKYILPLDADDIIHETYVEQCVEVLENHPEYKLVYSRARFFGKVNKEWKLPTFSMETMLGRNCIYCSAMYRKSDFEETKGYNPNMKEGLEDWDFWLSFLGDGARVYKINKVLFFYRIKRCSRNNSFKKQTLRELRKRLWENHKVLFSRYYMDPRCTMEYISVRYSIEYIIGKVLCAPFRLLSRIVN